MSVITVRVGTIGSVIDMMRYDKCWPATEDDFRKLMRIADQTRKKATQNIVQFIRAGATTRVATERWESFGCEVIDVRSVDAPPFDMAPYRVEP